MSLRTTAETLDKIWKALNASPPEPVALTHPWEAAVRNGWMTDHEIEDAILLCDRRLDRHGLEPMAFADMLKLTFRPIFQRPASRFDDPSGYHSLSATDAAAILILLERLGFVIDAEWLCARVRSALASASHLTWQEVDVLFHDQSMGKTTPLILETATQEWRGINRRSLKTPLGYAVEYVTGDDGSPLWLTVKAPRYRKRPEPTLVTCPKCKHSYVKGLPSEDSHHRQVHRRRLAILDPQPDRLFAEAYRRDPLAAPWVDYTSSQWKHDHMYRRAFAFKRELGYTFSQWAEKPIHDPEPVGYLFADEDGRVVGSAAFRPQSSDDRPWRLDWIWLAPGFRRQGYLNRHWAMFRQRFGEFDVEPPLSEGMTAFLHKHGASHLA